MNGEMKSQAEDQAKICSIFANAKRVMILWSVSGIEKSVTDIAEDIDASLQSTSQHLHLMKDQNILDSRRDGQTIYYRISDSEVLKNCGVLCMANITANS